MGTLLLLSLFLSPAGSFGPLNTSPHVTAATDGSKTLVSQPFSGFQDDRGNFDSMGIDGSPDRGRICLKIRAFIFETNDDQVPRFVRETTCTPVTAKTKNVEEPTEPKLVPATVK